MRGNLDVVDRIGGEVSHRFELLLLTFSFTGWREPGEIQTIWGHLFLRSSALRHTSVSCKALQKCKTWGCFPFVANFPEPGGQ